MYASLGNQLYHLAHYFFSFWLLMVIVPMFLFHKPTTSEWEDVSDRLVSRYVRISVFYIGMGYLLVLTNLFEVLAIATCLLLLMFRDYLRKSAKSMRAFTFVSLLFYETLDLGFRLKKLWPQMKVKMRGRWQGLSRRGQSREKLLPRVLLVALLLGSAYLRFDDAWHTAAPAMSDGYVTLVWMKYLEERILQHHDALFHDGIYPQGFHLTLALLHKFAAIDPLYVLRYTGPWNGVLMTYGLYFATSRWCGNRWAGIAAAALYGLGGIPFHSSDDWDRQAATNSQEFAMVFAFPSLLYLTRFLQKGKREDLFTGAAGVAVTGLVHTLLFAFVGMGMAVQFVVGMVLNRQAIKRVWHLVLVGVGSVILAVIPLGIGKLLGRGLNSSSQQFLVSKVTITPPTLRIWDELGLVSLAVLFLAFWISRKPFRERVMQAVAIGLIGGTFLLYEYGAALTSNQVLATRSLSLWSLTIPFALGLGLHTLWSVLQKVPGQRFMQAATCVALVCWLVDLTHLAPIIPYKMEWESGVEQYLQIADSHPPKTWMLVTDHTEGYDEVLGNGYHMYIDQEHGKLGSVGLMDYDPTLPALTMKGRSNPDRNVPNDIYIYLEKHVFEVSKSNSIYSVLAADYADRQKEQGELQAWIATYQKDHHNLQVYYEDENVRIYHIHITPSQGQEQQQLWGGSN